MVFHYVNIGKVKKKDKSQVICSKKHTCLRKNKILPSKRYISILDMYLPLQHLEEQLSSYSDIQLSLN